MKVFSDSYRFFRCSTTTPPKPQIEMPSSLQRWQKQLSSPNGVTSFQMSDFGIQGARSWPK